MQHSVNAGLLGLALLVPPIGSDSAFATTEPFPSQKPHGCAIAHLTEMVARAEHQRDEADMAYRQSAALARSARGSKRALRDAGARLKAAEFTLRRTVFALAEAQVAFGDSSSFTSADCDAEQLKSNSQTRHSMGQ